MCRSQTGFALQAGFDAWGWGENSAGQGGNNVDINDHSSPVSVIGGFSFKQIVGGFLHTLGLDTNGACWAWGASTEGQLGDNATDSVTDRSSPVSVVGAHSFISISAGDRYSSGLKADGTVWMWGSNDNGQLGDNTKTDKSSPVSVVGAHSFVELSVGSSEAMARKNDGTVWTWGRNNVGQLGNNSTTETSSPVSVVGEHSFVEISGGGGVMSARKNDGTLWMWGSAYHGNLGDNTTTNKSSPVSVVGAHSFIEISLGSSFSMARKNDGTVWTWGINSNGQLGNNTVTTKQSSPVLVVGNHSFIGISGQLTFALALKENGEVWCWGNNASGQLGDNTTTERSSPVGVVGTI